jgi:cell division protein FtsW
MKRPPDYIILAITLILVFFGMAMIASVSVYESYNKFQENDYYFWRRIVQMIVAFAGFAFCFLIPYRFWERISLLVMIGSIILLLMVFTPFGAVYNGAKGWLDFPFLPSIQPVEIAKFGLIIYIAHWMSKNRAHLDHLKYGFFPFVIILCTIIFPLVLQPDFGSILVITLTAVAIFLAAGGSLWHVTAGGLVAGIMGIVVAFNFDHVYNRFATFFNPELDTLGISYQIKNALTAIGSGGLFGLGFGQSIQKNGYLPQVQGDTIFAAISEEMGFIRTVTLILLFALFAWRGYYIASQAKESFAKLIVVGFTTSITVQMLINVAVNMALLPNTGITLPFISYGGSSLLVSLMMVGIILNVSSGTTEEYRPRQVGSTVGRGKYRW